MKLGLGTAQWGMDYGVSNREGKTSRDEVALILHAAADAGVRVLDTAPAYGDAEEALGTSLWDDHSFRVVTKVPAGTSMAGDARRSLECSLERLGQARVYGLLAHRAEDLLGPTGDEVFAAMDAARAERLVERVGVSVYTPEELDVVVERYSITLVQVPLSVADRRFVSTGAISRSVARGVEVHTRSAFLQGALLMPAAELPGHLRTLEGVADRLRDLAHARDITPAQAALGFVLGVPGIEAVVCGVTSLAEFETLAAAKPMDEAMFAGMALADPDVLDPSRWPRAEVAR